MRMPLSDKRIFITGAGGVLGRAYINLFLENGASVIATELRGKAAQALQARFGARVNFAYYDLDVSDEGAIEAIFKTIQADGLNPNVVINNAAITAELLMGDNKPFADFAQSSVADWEKTLRVNLTAAFMIARQMDRDIVGKYPAQLINVASMYALNGPHHSIYKDMPFKSFAAYSASKAGVHGLTLWLAGYWAARDCTVNTIAPGAVFNKHSAEFQNRIGNLVMNGRMAQPEEIANVMAFLCSESARYMTGQIIHVDGGFSAW